jgi:trehalose 6-phosphate synthase
VNGTGGNTSARATAQLGTRAPARLVIASNRGPVERRAGPGGRVDVHRGSGGLVAVLGSALAAAGGVWVAAAITGADAQRAGELARTGRLDQVRLPEGPVRLRMLHLDPVVYRGYYRAISTELLWFLHHQMFDLTRQPVMDATLRAEWGRYRAANAAFARGCAEEVAPGGTVLLQDYHLALAPRQLRRLRPDARSAHFTMVPWADPGYFAVLPDDLARNLIDGMLGADMVCFLVPRWADAFLACCAGLGYPVDAPRRIVRDGDGRDVAVRCFPVGVDPDELRARAGAADVAAHKDALRRTLDGRKLVLRVDRMEPSKNVLRGLAGFAELLERDPVRRGRVVHLVLAYSSRGDLAPYRAYAADVEASVRRINARFGRPGWQPVLLETGNDYGRGLAAMAVADVLVVNPVRDGMNLVAKEGPVVSERDLALVLSTQAGAADDLSGGALLVDPFDVTSLADAIAIGLDLPPAERAARLRRLRAGAGALPPRRWLDAALAELDRSMRE